MMTTAQRVVVWTGTMMFVGTGLYPPWISVWGPAGQFKKPLGYHWLFLPPSESSVELDIPRLAIQWVLVAAVSVALMWARPSIPFRRLLLIPIPTFGPTTRRVWSHVLSPALFLLSVLWFAEAMKPTLGFTHKIKVAVDQFFGFEYWGLVAILILIAVACLSGLRDWQAEAAARRQSESTEQHAKVTLDA